MMEKVYKASVASTPGRN